MSCDGQTNSYDVYMPAAEEAFSYDLDGNLASDGIWNYTWDGENRLIRMDMSKSIITALEGQSESGLSLTFAYDGMGRRISNRSNKTSDYNNHTLKGDLSDVVRTDHSMIEQDRFIMWSE